MASSASKTELRQAMRALLRQVSPEERHRLSVQLCAVLDAQPVWQSASAVLLFSPLPDEPEIGPVLDRALAEGKSVHLPKFLPDAGHYSAARVTGRSQLTRGQFGILEPVADCPAVPVNQLDFALVPALAFDLAGCRLGRGKGFYDRLLAEVRGHKCGLCFDAQVVPAVPVEPHDVRVDSILTPTRWHSCLRAA